MVLSCQVRFGPVAYGKGRVSLSNVLRRQSEVQHSVAEALCCFVRQWHGVEKCCIVRQWRGEVV